MKQVISLFSFVFLFSFSAYAQVQDGQMDQSIDKSLDQIDSFLDTFDLHQLFGPQMLEMMPSPEEMGQIQDQMRIGLEQLQGFDFSVFESFLKEMEKSMPQLKEMIPQDLPQFKNEAPSTPNKSSKPIKKI